MRWPAKLIGGPFDGDQGSLTNERTRELPESLWVTPCGCGNPRSRCSYGGVRWFVTSDQAQAESPHPAKYDFDRLESDEQELGVAVYVYGESNLGLDAAKRGELAHA